MCRIWGIGEYEPKNEIPRKCDSMHIQSNTETFENQERKSVGHIKRKQKKKIYFDNQRQINKLKLYLLLQVHVDKENAKELDMGR
jgi:hypothetical protein